MRCVVVIATVVCIVVVFVTPGVTLPRTAMRAQQAAKQLFSSMCAAALARLPLTVTWFTRVTEPISAWLPPPSRDPLALAGALLC